MLSEQIRSILKSKSTGLGDTVEKIAEVSGIKSIVTKATKGDCGCNKRKQKLNELFPYNQTKDN